MINQLLVTTKSIMYKIISLGYSAYLDEDDNYIINKQVCSKCGEIWNNSRTECFYCGTDNFHVYKCDKCGALYSITNASKKCGSCGSKKFVKVCLNPNCISNTNQNLKRYVNKMGGVFNKNTSASMLNAMRCHKCGNKSSFYKTMKIRVVDCKPPIIEKNVLYVNKLKDSFEIYINDDKNNLKSIEEILNYYFR